MLLRILAGFLLFVQSSSTNSPTLAPSSNKAASAGSGTTVSADTAIFEQYSWLPALIGLAGGLIVLTVAYGCYRRHRKDQEQAKVYAMKMADAKRRKQEQLQMHGFFHKDMPPPKSLVGYFHAAHATNNTPSEVGLLVSDVQEEMNHVKTDMKQADRVIADHEQNCKRQSQMLQNETDRQLGKLASRLAAKKSAKKGGSDLYMAAQLVVEENKLLHKGVEKHASEKERQMAKLNKKLFNKKLKQSSQEQTSGSTDSQKNNNWMSS